jgi:curved DNA-binding protein CbpA
MKKLISFEDIDRARKVLELGETASMQEIKNKYRELSLKYHPDRYNSSLDKNKYEEKIKEINNSYEIITNYCIKYPISFNAEEAGKIEDGEYIKQHYRKFYGDWWWGGKSDKK